MHTKMSVQFQKHHPDHVTYIKLHKMKNSRKHFIRNFTMFCKVNYAKIQWLANTSVKTIIVTRIKQLNYHCDKNQTIKLSL